MSNTFKLDKEVLTYIGYLWKAALSIGLTEPPQMWYRAMEEGLRVHPTSCHCGGDWAWVKMEGKASFSMVGCICHTDLSQFGISCIDTTEFQEHVKEFMKLFNDQHPGLATWEKDIKKSLRDIQSCF